MTGLERAAGQHGSAGHVQDVLGLHQDACVARDWLRRVAIDVSAARFWDISGVGALDKIVARLRRDGAAVEVSGYDRASAELVDRFALHDKTGVELGAVPR